MASYNKVLLMGNLTRDVQLKSTSGGQSVAEIGLALNRKYKTKDGQDREEVTYVDCECWGPRAEVISKYFSKGKPIFIEGRLKLDTWEDKDGQKRSKLRVVGENMTMLGSRNEGGGGPPSGGGGGGGYRGGQARGGGAPAAAPQSDGGDYGGYNSGGNDYQGGGGPPDDEVPF